MVSCSQFSIATSVRQQCSIVMNNCKCVSISDSERFRMQHRLHGTNYQLLQQLKDSETFKHHLNTVFTSFYITYFMVSHFYSFIVLIF